MSRIARIFAAGALALATLAAGAAWLIRVNSGTAKDACLHNLKQIDAAIQQWNTNAPVAEELKPLQGYWEGDGAGGKCSITITGNSLHYRNSKSSYKTTFTLPAGTDPQQLHATIHEASPPSSNALGTVVFAIFKIEDGTLTLAEDDMSDKPPKSFDSALSRYTVRKIQP